MSVPLYVPLSSLNIQHSQSLLFFFSASPMSWVCVVANCSPQCQNGGMCLRPQLCVCKPGSKGKACEQKTQPSSQPFPAPPGNEPTNGHRNGHTTANSNGYNVVPQWPIPQQVAPNGYASASSPASNAGQMKLTVKPYSQLVRPHYIQQQIQQQ